MSKSQWSQGKLGTIEVLGSKEVMGALLPQDLRNVLGSRDPWYPPG